MASVLESPAAEASAPESPAAEVAGVVGGGADRGAGGFDDDLVGDRVQLQLQAQGLLARQRAAAAPEVELADASSSGQPADDRAAPAVSLDEIIVPTSAQNRPGRALSTERRAVSSFENAAGPTTPFLLPGLPVRDVRLALAVEGLASRRGGSVVVTQELADGRLVELEFIPLAGDGRREDALQNRNESLVGTRPSSVLVRRVGLRPFATYPEVWRSCRDHSPSSSWHRCWTSLWGHAEAHRRSGVLRGGG